MPDVEETLEINIPPDQTGLSVSSNDNVPEASEQINPQNINPQEHPQNIELSTDNPHTILCGLDECKESFSNLESLKEHMKQMHNKHKNAGRPCQYCENKEKYQSLTEEYLKKSRQKTGEKVAIPFIEELADVLDKDDETITIWANKRIKDKEGKDTEEFEHPEFAQVIKRILSLQKLRLLQRTLGRFNPTGAIFQLKVNHGLIETEKRVLAGAVNEPLLVEIINEDRKNLEENE